MKKLTIITINYNNAIGLKKTIQSIVEQSFLDFEYIVIDGGSTDESVSIIKENENKIHYWVSEKDKGIYNAMNKGIEQATSEYVLFVNSGDYLFSNSVIEKSISYLNDIDLITFDLECLSETQKYLFPAPDALKFSNLYFGTLPHPSTFIKRKLFNEIGYYDETLKIVSDWKFFILALYKFDCSYLKVNQVLTTFCLDGVSSTQDFSQERKLVLKEFFPDFIEDYTDLAKFKSQSKTKGYKLFVTIEKYTFGRKMLSLFYRIINFFR